jgi:hypothetical protein
MPEVGLLYRRGERKEGKDTIFWSLYVDNVVKD